jgi:hypothetical protein
VTKKKTIFELAEEFGRKDQSLVGRVLRGELGPDITGKWTGELESVGRLLRELESRAETEQTKPLQAQKSDDGHQDKCNCKGCMAKRAKVRCAWLKEKLEPRGWTRNVLSRQQNAPTYNTIGAYCEGRKTRQAIQIRFGIAKALSVDISEVPE